jgi:hypothetical protein
MVSEGAQAGESQRRRVRFPVVVVAVIILSALASLLGIHIPSSNSGANAPSIAELVAGGPRARGEVDGIVMTLRISAGPYFLSELVAVEITLANNSQATYVLQGVSGAVGCEQVLWAELAGGGPPSYTLPTSGFISCPGLPNTLTPGQTWMVDYLMPLTESGSARLTGQARFFAASIGPNGTQYMTTTPGPLAGHWPTIARTVAPSVPPDRLITLRSSSILGLTSVSIAAPPSAGDRLLYIDDVRCREGNGGNEQPRLTWQPVNGDRLIEPWCTGSDTIWHFSVGAPGYAVASGSYPPGT